MEIGVGVGDFSWTKGHWLGVGTTMSTRMRNEPFSDLVFDRCVRSALRLGVSANSLSLLPSNLAVVGSSSLVGNGSPTQLRKCTWKRGMWWITTYCFKHYNTWTFTSSKWMLLNFIASISIRFCRCPALNYSKSNMALRLAFSTRRRFQNNCFGWNRYSDLSFNYFVFKLNGHN